MSASVGLDQSRPSYVQDPICLESKFSLCRLIIGMCISLIQETNDTDTSKTLFGNRRKFPRSNHHKRLMIYHRRKRPKNIKQALPHSF